MQPPRQESVTRTSTRVRSLQFTRLRLLGFKSFVDPTELVIAPGLTGVVGPNGCGKSNLLEALRWVMGENRAKSMRGDGMDDVIFAGTGSRPQRNRAEVTLTLDNRARLAPAAFNDSDTLEIVRRITREAGSAYRTNGKEARARDVQMLFADASTGAHSPALVGQGRISELINAKPRARRRVLEEAAGISGLYQRRHEAELKLRATEANLARVADVIEALESQITALARQARQAARYREIADALRRAEHMLIWRLWSDAEAERHTAAAALLAATRTSGSAQTEAAAAIRARDAAEAALPAVREEDAIAGAVLQHLSIERDRIENESREVARLIADLTAKVAQIETDRTRETSLDGDAVGMTEKLEAERTALLAEGEGHAEALDAARLSADRAAEDLRRAERAFDAQAETAAKLAAEHEAAKRALADAERKHGETVNALALAEQALSSAGGERDQAEAAHAAAEAAAEATAAAAAEAEETLDAAEEATAAARADHADLRDAVSEAEGQVRALTSEAAGLEKLLERRPGEAAQILDSITAEPGFEAALGAALGEDLSLPLAGETPDADGWHALPPLDSTRPLPDGAEPLADRVTGPDALARRLAQTGVVTRADGERLHPALGPGQRLVSREGDLWRWDGLRVSAGSAPTAAALRLQQRNRLAALVEQRDAAAETLAEVRTEAETSAARLNAATMAEQTARSRRKSTDQAASEAGRALTRAEAAREAAAGRVRALESACDRRRREVAAAKAELATATAAGASLDDPEAARAVVAQERLKVEAARITMLTHRAAADELDRAGTARERRLGEITREAETWARRQAEAAVRLADLDRREAETAAALEAARERPDALEHRLAELAEAHTEAETRRRNAADALAEAESGLRDLTARSRAAEKAAGDAREARARFEALAEAANTAAEHQTERLTGETGKTPETLLAALGTDADGIPAQSTLEDQVNTLKRQRDSLGAVNLRAEEDAREVEAEHAELSSEKTDLEDAIAKLRQGISSLNREGRERLLDAFAEVNRNFTALFKHLFNGGEANLVLVESDDPLEAGLEIMCQPPGKKLSTLSLLSGGEQTLTALSLIFAVFLANPSPICVLDEVDAPLDDANVTRFCDLLDEMTKRTNTRFLIITHHAVTMTRMDRLFGVTMAEQGVSQLVSVDLAAAERILEDA